MTRDSNLPIMRIHDAWLLRENVSVHFNTFMGDGKPLRTDEEYAEIVQAYKSAWRPYEKKILRAMCDLTGLEFRQNIVDVYIAPYFGAFSEPMIIGVRLDPDHFVDILTHELLHRLLTDNTVVTEDTKLLDVWQGLFGDDMSFRALVHIPVHAIHKAIYLDILGEEPRLHRDVDTCKRRSAADYIKAWEYLGAHGYKGIVEKLRKSYKDMQS